MSFHYLLNIWKNLNFLLLASLQQTYDMYISKLCIKFELLIFFHCEINFLAEISMSKHFTEINFFQGHFFHFVFFISGSEIYHRDFQRAFLYPSYAFLKLDSSSGWRMLESPFLENVKSGILIQSTKIIQS